MISQFETWRYVRTVKKKSSQLRSLPTETNCKPQTFSSKPSQKGKARNGEVFTLYTRRQKKQNVCVYIYILWTSHRQICTGQSITEWQSPRADADFLTFHVLVKELHVIKQTSAVRMEATM